MDQQDQLVQAGKPAKPAKKHLRPTKTSLDQL